MSGENGTPAPVAALKKDPGMELLAHLGNLRQMEAGFVAGENGDSTVEKDPLGAIDQLADYINFARERMHGLEPVNHWQEKLGGESVDATDLAPFIDMEFPWLIEPLLCRGFLTQIQGAPKGGKSAFSLWLSLLAATGEWNKIKALESTPAEPRKVLYIAWEDPKILMAKRLSQYAVGLGYERTFLPKNIRFLFAPTFFANRADHVAAIQEAIKEYGADIVVIDTLSYAHECEENVADQMRVPMGNLSKMANDLQVSILYVHHTAKGAKEKSSWERGRGSAAIAAAWHILIDWGQREEGSDINPVLIQSKLGVDGTWQVHYNRQCNHPTDPKKVTGVAWSIETGDNKVDISAIAAGKKREKSGLERVHETLQSLYIESPKGVPGKNIVSCLADQGLGKSIVYRHLGELEETGVAAHKTVGKATFYFLTGV